MRGFVASAAGGSTIGGGRIIRVLAPKARKGAQHAAAVGALAAARLDQRLALEVRNAAAAGLAQAELVRRLGLPASALADPLATLVAGGELLAVGDHYLHAQSVAELEQKIQALATADGISREELRTHLSAALPVRAYDAILAGLERRGLVASDGDRVRKQTEIGRAHV